MTANPLRAARGTTTSLAERVLKDGELAYNTDTERLVVGDGVTLGGIEYVPENSEGGVETRLDALEALLANVSAPIDADWAAVIQAATIAAGQSLAGFGTEDTPTLTGLVLAGAPAGGAALDINPTASSSAMGLDIDQSGPNDGSNLGANYFYNDILINGDNAVVGTTAYGLAVRMGVGGALLQGQRTALRGQMVFNTTSSASNAYKIYAGLSGEAQAADDDGGTDTSSGAKGSLIGSYASSILGNGATNWLRNDGLEINPCIRTGGSARWLRGLVIAKWADSAVQGAEQDAAIWIGNQDGAAPWATDGIRFDSTSAGADTAMFGPNACVFRGTGTESLTSIFDFPNYTATGFYINFANFKVTGAGAVSASNFDTDGTFAANSDTRLPTQKAAKTYVDAAVAAGVAALLNGVAASYDTLAELASGKQDVMTTGSWTPVLTAATPGNLSITYSAQVGSYLKIGSLVIATCRIVTSAFTHTTASGNATVTGLPFTAENVSNQFWSGPMTLNGFTQANYTNFNAQVRPNTTEARIQVSGSGQTQGTAAITAFPTGGSVSIDFTVIYKAA